MVNYTSLIVAMYCSNSRYSSHNQMNRNRHWVPYSEISKDNQNHTWSKYILREKTFPEGNVSPWAVRLIYKTRTHHDNLQTNLDIYVTNITTINTVHFQVEKMTKVNQNVLSHLPGSNGHLWLCRCRCCCWHRSSMIQMYYKIQNLQKHKLV